LVQAWWTGVLLGAVLALVVGASSAAASTVDNFPCAGCVVSVPPGYSRAHAVALLVALHGDEGNPGYISSVWDPVGDHAGAIVLTPECPRALGCPGSWWGWLQGGRYDDAWLGRQVAAVEARYNVDRSREYLTGWSGGADFLGWYALAHAGQFAAAGFVVGGVPYYQQCPVKPLPAYFLMGSHDFRYASGQPSQVQHILDVCGDPTRMIVLPGADHSGTVAALSQQGYATTIFRWLEQYARGGPSPSLPGSPTTSPVPGPTPGKRHKRKKHKHKPAHHRAPHISGLGAPWPY
jgi:poly(3-hydroxybutyrate) depolymerase